MEEATSGLIIVLLQSKKDCYNFVLRNAKKFTETFERHENLETCLKWAFLMKHCASLTPLFKVRILIPLPRENRHPHGCLFFSSIEEDKDSKNRLAEQAKPANAKVLRNTQNL